MKLTPQDSSPPVALLEHVGQQFGATIALRDISLAIPARRMVGLIGPDGVGKSSLLSLIAGARTIEQGNVMVLGGDMRDMHHRREVCPKIAWMPQGLGKNLYHTLSVYENVDFFARLLSISGKFCGCQDQVRFFALHRIKPHAPPLVRAPVNSFEF